MADQLLTGGTGADGRLKVGAVYLKVTGYSFDPNCELHEITNSESAGNEEWQAGLKSASGSFTAQWNATAAPTDAPNLQPGTTVSLTLEMANGQDITFDAIVTSLPITTEVKGIFTYTCNFKVTGAVTFPASL